MFHSSEESRGTHVADSRHAFDQVRAAFELVDDGIVFADVHDRILFANAAAARLSGGRNATDGADAIALVEAAQAAGVVVVRLPRNNPDGTRSGWTAVLRDARGAQSPDEAQRRHDRDRDVVLDLLGHIHPGGTLEETAGRLCEAVAGLSGFDGAMIMMLPPSGDLVHIEHAGRARVPYKPGQRLPLKDLEPLIDMTIAGPWAVATMSSEAFRMFGPLAVPMRAAGVRASAYAAIRTGSTLLGVLSVASLAKDGLRILEERLGTLSQLAGVASSILGAQAAEYGRLEVTRAAVHDCLDHARFRPVFQPIVHLVDGSVHAYESLTRFDDGVAPDLHFLEAHRVGLGAELEVAAMSMAIEASRRLPAGARLTLNLSPDVLAEVAGGELLRASQRQVIIEVTEHTRIEDYGLLLDALARAPHLMLSVDDAGAGFASLRHILELQPAYVKLDIGLVRDVDKDPARAALVAGMCHFARVTGKVLIAEGIETAEEAATLRQLGVELGQGYHFGRPAPVDTFL